MGERKKHVFSAMCISPVLYDAGNPDALTRSGLLSQVQKGKSKKKVLTNLNQTRKMSEIWYS